MGEKLKTLPAPENPLLAEQGLTTDQQYSYGSKRLQERADREDADRYQFNSKKGPLAQKSAETAEAAAIEEFRQNEGAFAVQAVHDADKAGKKTSFGTTEAEITRLRKEAGYPGAEEETVQKREAA